MVLYKWILCSFFKFPLHVYTIHCICNESELVALIFIDYLHFKLYTNAVKYHYFTSPQEHLQPHFHNDFISTHSPGLKI